MTDKHVLCSHRQHYLGYLDILRFTFGNPVISALSRLGKLIKAIWFTKMSLRSFRPANDLNLLCVCQLTEMSDFYPLEAGLNLLNYINLI